ncbi:DNA primase [Gimesia chilikensis]|uniref:DNA primase n=1 Tax=Gimesia chilikensis TaxID=2605989 RepID=A0A517W9N1_9PLAN|nr:hypothetical protein [Gimesia chilikensis]QDU01966.1 DNA primase [Gimesia chilikensis]
MTNVINERLFRNLKRVFKSVRISNPRQAAMVTYRKDHIYRKGREKAEVVTWGEVYSVNCPFCSDTRKRLSICNIWAERDQKTNDDMLHLAKCHNESCLATREMQKQLHAIVYPNGKFSRSIPESTQILKSAPLSVPKSIVKLPEGKDLREVSSSNRAIRYLESRGFDMDELAETWEVKYCPVNQSERPFFNGSRILIPVYRPCENPFAKGLTSDVELAGWQARQVKAENDRPKYYTSRGMKKNEVLYGLRQAINTLGTIVVVEGVTDVWRYGPGAVALLGKSVSLRQAKLLNRHFMERPIVIILDRDASDDAKKVQTTILQARRERGDWAPVRICQLPSDSEDPGDCTRDKLHQMVTEVIR